MIKTIIPTLFTIYSLSSANRILLQTPAEPGTGTAPIEPAVPIPPPPEPLPPAGATPGVQEPAPGTAVVEPGTATGTVEPPATGGGAAVEPGTSTGGGGLPWTQTGSTGTAGVKTECTITPPAVGTCAETSIIISNPDEHWTLHSDGLGAMYRSTVTIDIPPLSLLPEIQGFFFTERYAAYEATITINNPTGRQIPINTCECTEDFSCYGLTIYTGPDSFFEAGDFYCDPQKRDACTGCMIKENAADVGLPCTAYA